ncbi:unnamed protein product [[Candida] boidinii]|nr:unnamed protein product [[Candida] boidinii]
MSDTAVHQQQRDSKETRQRCWKREHQAKAMALSLSDLLFFSCNCGCGCGCGCDGLTMVLTEIHSDGDADGNGDVVRHTSCYAIGHNMSLFTRAKPIDCPSSTVRRIHKKILTCLDESESETP